VCFPSLSFKDRVVATALAASVPSEDTAGAEEGILKGMYLLSEGHGEKKAQRVQLLGSGTILREVIAAADLLKSDFGVVADVCSCPSFAELRREGMEAERWNMLHPDQPQRKSYVERALQGRHGPAIAASDYMKVFADQIRPFVKRIYRVLGTDGFGRSDFRKQLRKFFEVDRYYVTVAALKALADDGGLPASVVTDAIKKYALDPEKAYPPSV
jgi:pyruvate dehydrogenase E1 component